MIPNFNEHGYLPPGVYSATLDEIALRFGQGTELRRVQMESLRWFVSETSRLHIERLIVNGSFVTDESEPNDVDCVALVGKEYNLEEDDESNWESDFPFLQIQVVGLIDFRDYVDVIFGTDRQGDSEGRDRGDLMTISSLQEVENTKRKINWLEERVNRLRGRPEAEAPVARATLRSLRATMKELREEVLRYEARQRQASKGRTR